jgi:hypothetical protein
VLNNRKNIETTTTIKIKVNKNMNEPKTAFWRVKGKGRQKVSSSHSTFILSLFFLSPLRQHLLLKLFFCCYKNEMF